MELNIFNFHEWKPLEIFGFTHAFWTIHIDTLLCTWIAMIALFFTCKVLVHILTKQPESMATFIIKSTTKSIIEMATETLGRFDQSCFTFSMGLFLFSAFCTLVSLIPFVEEATRDINTTFALALISFIFVQYQGFKAHGASHLKEYTQPFIFMLPMHVIGDLAKITSMSFRLFGNILAGSVILQLMFLALAKIGPYITYYALFVGALVLCVHGLTKLNPKYKALEKHLPKLYAIFFLPAGLQFFFGLFEGLIQSGIVALLTLTYTGLTINNHPSDS